MARYEAKKECSCHCNLKDCVVAVFFILLPFVGTLFVLLAGINHENNQKWYSGLEKPSWQPPSSLFGPVSICLFAMMGLASYLVYRNGRCRDEVIGEEKKPFFKDNKVKFVLAFYLFHLILNWAWSPLLFGLHQILGALIEICCVWVTVVTCAVLFWPYSRVATALFVPYILWVSFVTLFNGRLWWLNRDSNVPLSDIMVRSSTAAPAPPPA